MDRIRLNVGKVLEEAIEYVDRLPHATGDEVGEKSNVRVRDVVVADSSIPSVADVVLREQVLLVQIPLGAINRSTFPGSPAFGQRKAVVGVDNFPNRLLQTLFSDVAPVNPGNLSTISAAHGARSLSRPKLTTITKYRCQVPGHRIIELRIVTGNRPEIPRPLQPVFGILQDIQ